MSGIVYLGPSDHLVYEGQVIQRGMPLHVQGKELERLKRLGHLFEGHSEPVGPLFVDQPRPEMPPMGANSTPLTAGEIAASSSQHVEALHKAAAAEAKAEAEPERESERAEDHSDAHARTERAKR